jgi:hypothetical protein
MVKRIGGDMGRNSGTKREQNRGDEIPLLQWVKLAEIERSDELFAMNFEPDLAWLRESAKQIGILEPIWVRRKRGKLQIINGFRRFDVAQTLKMRMLRALIWGEDQIGDRIAFEMGFHGNILARGLNVVEKAMTLEKLLSRFGVSRDEVIRTWLPLLNLDPNEKVLSSFLLVNTFSLDVKRYLLIHGLSLNNIMLLSEFSPDERRMLCRSLSRLRIGENVLREILTHLKEIARRDGIGITDLVSNPRIQSALSGNRLSGPQRIEAIRKFLKEKRYPRLSELEGKFRLCKKRMGLPPQIEIAPPPFFEGDRFKVQFHFGSQREYEAILGTLKKLSKEGVGNLLAIKGYSDGTV